MSDYTSDRAALGFSAANDEDVYSGEDCSRPFMASDEPYADPAVKVVGLSDVEHAKRLWRPSPRRWRTRPEAS